jgi:hypothetical protein
LGERDHCGVSCRADHFRRTDDNFMGATQLGRTHIVPPAVEECMTADPKKAELERRALMLETACRQLLLRPQDALAREHLARSIAATTLVAEVEDSTSMRAVVDEVQARADSLAFRLESAGYNGLYISAATAMLCQTLAQLRMQLTSLDAQTLAIRLPGEIASPV